MSASKHAQCPRWADFPYDTQGTIGAFLGTNIIVCGGIPHNVHADKCHIITQKSTKVLLKMKSKRYEAASLVIREKYLWVSGGNDGTVTLSSTEFIEIESAEGPELPSPLEGHKMVEVTEDLTLVVGGSNKQIPKSSTLYFHHDKTHHEKGQWSDGPTMLFKRRDHAVGVITDETTLKKLIAVTGGSKLAPRSTEFCFDKVWFEGKMV